MFNELIIKNFQSHKETILQFQPGLNIIIGKSNSGKTAILRDLNWIINNRPSGSGIIRHGEKLVESSLNIDEIIVTKVRDKKGSRYSLSEPAIDFEAVGTDVPLEIKRVLNMGDVNVQDQLSPYFLVLDTPGQIAQYIRTVAGLEDVDKVIGRIAEKVREKSQHLSKVKTNRELKVKELAKYDRIDLVLLEELIEKYARQEEKVEECKDIVEDLSLQIVAYEKAKKAVIDFKQIDLDGLQECIGKLETLVVEEVRLESDIEVLQGSINELSKANNVDKIRGLDKVLDEQKEESNRWVELSHFVEELDELIDSWEDNKQNLKRVSTGINDNSSIENELLSQLDNCPYCGSELCEKTKEVLIKGVI